jgi:hypothetical protein
MAVIVIIMMMVSAAPNGQLLASPNCLAELSRDDLTEHHALRAANHHRRDEIADRGDEFNNSCSDYTRHRQR